MLFNQGTLDGTTMYLTKKFNSKPSLQRLEVKLAERSGGVITNERPCKANSGELALRFLEGDCGCEHQWTLQYVPIGWGRKPQLLDPRIPGSVQFQDKVISTWDTIFDEQTSDKPFDYGTI
jgi:hypothetical protein